MFSQLLQQRQSVRRYSDRPVEREKVIKCVEAIRLSPSACNAQPWTVIVVDDPVVVKEIAKNTADVIMNKFVFQAPVWIALVIEKPNFTSWLGGKIKHREFAPFDIGIATANFCNQAAELGLGTCIIGWFNENKVKNILSVPAGKRIALLITLGYPPDGYRIREKIRKPIEQICKWNSYK